MRGGLTDYQVNKLDRLYQEMLIKQNKASFFTGLTEVIHHFKQGKQNLAIRWYVPNGLPVTNKQHGWFHSSKRKETEDLVIGLKGKKWLDDLNRQVNKTAKYLDFNKVKDHILGKTKNYVD